MATTNVAQPRAGEIGKPQRRYIVVPEQIPVPLPAREEPAPSVVPVTPAPEPEYEPETV